MSDVLIVRDVGHGNWNEIRGEDTNVFFDIGANKYYGKEDVKRLVQEADLEKSNKLILVISHWDVDHYHVLFGLEKSELRRIEKVIAPEPPINTMGKRPATIEKAIKLLEGESINIEYILKSIKTDNSTQKVEMHFSQKINSIISLYRSTGAKNKNLDSIVLYYDGVNKSALLTGDYYYDKLYGYVLISKKINELIMVIPHHGGMAGTFSKSDWKSIRAPLLICSWGKNNYGHSLNKLKQLYGGVFPHIQETNGTGSKCIML